MTLDYGYLNTENKIFTSKTAKPKLKNRRIYYLIPIEIRTPLIFAPLIFAPLIFAHPQISRPSNFHTPLFYCSFAVFSYIRDIFSSPFNFRVFALGELAPFNFRAG